MDYINAMEIFSVSFRHPGGITHIQVTSSKAKNSTQNDIISFKKNDLSLDCVSHTSAIDVKQEHHVGED